MNTLYLKPTAQRAVPDPAQDGALLPEAGAWVPHDPYWQRRLREGDVVPGEPPNESAKPSESIEPPILEPEPVRSKSIGGKRNGRKL